MNLDFIFWNLLNLHSDIPFDIMIVTTRLEIICLLWEKQQETSEVSVSQVERSAAATTITSNPVELDSITSTSKSTSTSIYSVYTLYIVYRVFF